MPEPMPSPPSCRAGRPLCGASLRWAHPCGAPQPICIMRVRASRQCRCHQWLGTPAVGDTSPLNQPPGYNTHCRTDITSSLCAPTAPTGRPAIGCRSSRAAQRKPAERSGRWLLARHSTFGPAPPPPPAAAPLLRRLCCLPFGSRWPHKWHARASPVRAVPPQLLAFRACMVCTSNASGARTALPLAAPWAC